MAASLTFHRLSLDEARELAETTDPVACKALIGEVFKCRSSSVATDEAQADVLIDLYFYLLAFCREQGFTPEKTSTLASIVYVVVKRDRQDGLSTMATSFDNFKRLVVAHSVERSPWSVGVFTVPEAEKIVDYFTNSYYRHFRLYKFTLCARPAMQLTQVLPNGVVEPDVPRPLAEAVPEHVAVASVAASEGKDGDDGSDDGEGKDAAGD